jgi:hypothetical protein
VSDAAAKRRARQTLINLLLSLGATIGVMLVLILAVPRDDSNRVQAVDYKELAAQAASQAPGPLLVPAIPVDWYSNSARFRSATQDGVATWYAGFVGPNSEFIALTQGFDVNQTWLQIQLEANKPTEEVVLGNSTWEIFESTKENNPQKSKDFLMLLEYDSNAVLVYGVAPRQQLEDFATQLSLLIEANNTN